MLISDGGVLDHSTSSASIGLQSGSTGLAIVEGSGATWNADNINVRGFGDGTLNVRTARNVSLTTHLDIRANGRLQIEGGEISTPSLQLNAILDFDSGTLSITGSGAHVGTGGVGGTQFGTLLNLSPNAHLNVSAGTVDVAADGLVALSANSSLSVARRY